MVTLNALVFICSGTTNVLAMDTLRALQSTQGKAFEVFAKIVNQRCAAAKEAKLDAGTTQPECFRSS